MKVHPGTGQHRNDVVLSLCDYSGSWPDPWWREGGYTVVQLDKKRGVDLTAIRPAHIEALIDFHVRPFRVRCILAAPLCTAFTSAAALHWKRQDGDGTTADCVALAEACMDIIEHFDPPTWALENPRGRIEKLVPRLLGMKRFEFDPCDFAGYLEPHLLDVVKEDPVEKVMASNRYTKRTGIWGKCRVPEYRRVDPLVYSTESGKQGGVIWAKLGDKSERTKEIRSLTPMGFARAFYSANGCV